MSDKRIVTSEKREHCGCVVREFADGTSQTIPCPGHALISAANHLAQAANAFAHVGSVLVQGQVNAANQQAFEQVAREVAKKS